jgi:hypothetical protein
LSIKVSGRKTRLFGEDLFDLGNPILFTIGRSWRRTFWPAGDIAKPVHASGLFLLLIGVYTSAATGE